VAKQWQPPLPQKLVLEPVQHLTARYQSTRRTAHETFQAGRYRLSDRADYEAAISAIEEAILPGKLNPQDKRQKATEFVEPRGWRSRIDGIDWVELGLYAEENKMPSKRWPTYCWFSNPRYRVKGSLEGRGGQGETQLNNTTSMGVNPQDDFFVALPDEEFKFGPPQCVDIRVPSTGASARVVVGDVGPWNGGHTYSGASLNDPYWSAGGVFTDGGFHPRRRRPERI